MRENVGCDGSGNGSERVDRQRKKWRTVSEARFAVASVSVARSPATVPRSIML